MQFIRFFLVFLFFVQFVCSDGNEDAQRLFQEGVRYQKQGKYAHAIKSYKEVIQTNPHWYQTYPLIGMCFEKLGYPKIAKKYYVKTRDYDPQNSKAVKALARLKREKLEKERLEEERRFKIDLGPGGKSSARQSLQDLRRMWILREGMLLTARRDGSDLQSFSQVAFSEMGVFPEGGAVGFPVIYQQTEGRPSVFFVYPDDGSMIRITAMKGICRNPVYLPDLNRVYFIYEEGEKVSLYYQEVKNNIHEKDPVLVSDEFLGIENPVLLGNNILYSAKKPDRQYKIFSLNPSNHVFTQESFGPGDDLKAFPSPDAKLLVVVREEKPKGKFLHLFTRGKNYNYQLSFDPASHLEGCFANDSKHFFYSLSKPGKEDRWETMVGQMEVGEKFVTKILQSNFLYREFKLNQQGDILYFLSNYNNNYELYRYKFQYEELERLTISEEDETQLGFWTFSNF